MSKPMIVNVSLTEAERQRLGKATLGIGHSIAPRVEAAVEHIVASRVADLQAKVDQLQSALRIDLALLEDSGCYYWACEGPDKPPVDMATCWVCSPGGATRRG